MRTLLFYMSIVFFMIGLFSLILVGTTASEWQIWLASFCTAIGFTLAAYISCVIPDTRLEETVPLTRPEVV